MTNNWVLRGLLLAAGMLVLRLIQGVLINTFEMHAMLINLVLLALFIAAVAVWGFFDGRENARSSPDPDRRADLAMTWLVAGLVAGVLSGAAAWLISLFDATIYTGGLINELTTFASFTALLVFVPAVGAVAAGRWQIDRDYEKVPVRHHGLAAHDERADTDVFAAVDGDVAATGAALSGAPTAVLEATEETTVAGTVEPVAATELTEPTTVPPDFSPTEPKKRWWHRRTPTAPTVPVSAAATTAYTMDETEPVNYDPDQPAATESAEEQPTTEISPPASTDDDQS